MEHDQRACPRCGEPAGDYHFCPSCLAPIDLPSESRAGAQLAAASDGSHATSGTSAAVVADDTTGDATKAPDQPAVDPNPQDVARLEDVLTPSKASGDSSADQASTADEVAAPAPPSELPIRLEVRLSDWSRTPRDVARLEDVLTVLPERRSDTTPESSPAPADVTDPPSQADGDAEHQIAPRTAAAALPLAGSVPPPSAEDVDVATQRESVPPPSAPAPASAPRYVAAHRLRSAFLFEQTSAFEARGDIEEIVDEVLSPRAPSPHAEPDASLDYVHAPQRDESASGAGQPSLGQTWHSRWLPALCFLGLIALVVVLTGRSPRRCGRANAS